MAMLDYYPFLMRAVQAADSQDDEARRAVYVRAWQIVTDELRARRPPVSTEELRAHRDAIQTAIERIEHEYSTPAPAVAPPRSSPRAMQRWAPVAAPPDEQFYPAPDDSLPAEPRSRWVLWAAAGAAAIVAAVAAGGYAALTSWTTPDLEAAPTAGKIEAAIHAPPLRRRHVVSTTTEDLAPGVDGGSTDADLSLIFRRQRVFYRTTLPPGTIVVDKPQHFAYLVMPQSSALRYGIGVGSACAELSGLRRIARKAEWPEWTPASGSSAMPGGPGNPLGARLLVLDDNTSRIHGTNAPKTIGEDVSRGCVRLVNDDVADLYNRVPLGTGVVLR